MKNYDFIIKNVDNILLFQNIISISLILISFYFLLFKFKFKNILNSTWKNGFQYIVLVSIFTANLQILFGKIYYIFPSVIFGLLIIYSIYKKYFQFSQLKKILVFGVFFFFATGIIFYSFLFISFTIAIQG